MERCVCSHRFGALLCVSAFLLAVSCGAVHAATSASVQSFAAQTVPAPASPSETPAPQTQAPPPPAKASGYTLSHERYEKAVTYSRAAYAMYFVSVGINVLALVILL